MGQYPEHDRLSGIKDKSQVVGEFMEWLADVKHYHPMQFLESWTNGKPKYLDRDGNPSNDIRDIYRNNPEYEYRPEGWYHPRESVTDLLAEFFGIDQDKLEDEKRAMLESLRAAHA